MDVRVFAMGNAGAGRDVLRIGVAIGTHPVHRLGCAAGRIHDHVRLLHDDTEPQALDLRDRIAVIERGGYRRR